LDTNELIRRAEQEVALGSRSARKTLDRARQVLLRQRDTKGLEHLLALAGRLDKPADLPHMIKQNLKLLERQAQYRPRNSKGGRGGRGDIAAVLGAGGGGVIGVALTFPILSGTEPSGLVYLAAWMFFGFVGALLGAGLAYGFWRLYRTAKTDG